ncbi:MAG TPA: nicotinate-nucleotide adenylyltransferase [Candidatus Acidoferrales bacterium]|nr:nicotinate-nucleotide adenylyltransferase [Candidatus Acidoferrales bacterium]
MSGTRRPTPGRTRRRKLRVGIFGGTFDPIHNGHLAVARAAQRRFRLDLIYFVPCGQPPHKRDPELSDYLHRFAMVALACVGERRFLPSLLEAGPDLRGRRRYYSIETVRRLRRLLGSEARLYFLLGADAFLYLPEWKNFRQLIRLCDFIVASRPGFSLRRARRVLPPELIRNSNGSGMIIHLSRSAIHFLPGLHADVSATDIRQRARRGQRLTALVPPAVADYIGKMELYRSRR